MLTGILASAEPQSFGRGERLRDYMRAFARSLNMTSTWELELTAMLSQIGYVTVPPKLLEIESDLRCLRSIRQGRLPTPPDEEQTAFRCDDVLGNLRSSVCH